MRRVIVTRALVAAGLLADAAAIPMVVRAAPAARVGDRTSHGGTILAPGSPDVFIEGRPAVRRNDQVVCPLFNGNVPHAGGPIVSGSASVFINGRPAARAGDRVTENEAESVLGAGSETVQIGN